MMMWRTHTTHVQQTIKKMIVIIGRAPCHMTEDVLPYGWLTNLVEAVVALIGKQVLAKFNRHQTALPFILRAAVSIDSTIGS